VVAPRFQCHGRRSEAPHNGKVSKSTCKATTNHLTMYLTKDALASLVQFANAVSW
jgi:hypothetical protein